MKVKNSYYTIPLKQSVKGPSNLLIDIVDTAWFLNINLKTIGVTLTHYKAAMYACSYTESAWYNGSIYGKPVGYVPISEREVSKADKLAKGLFGMFNIYFATYSTWADNMKESIRNRVSKRIIHKYGDPSLAPSKFDYDHPDSQFWPNVIHLITCAKWVYSVARLTPEGWKLNSSKWKTNNYNKAQLILEPYAKYKSAGLAVLFTFISGDGYVNARNDGVYAHFYTNTFGNTFNGYDANGIRALQLYNLIRKGAIK